MSETLRSGESVELYDGEGRTSTWWGIIFLGAVIASMLFYALFGFGYWVLQEADLEYEGSQIPTGLQKLGRSLERLMSKFELNPRQLVGIGILLGIGIFILTMGFSMIFSNFAYCLFRWNIVILLLVGVSTFFVMYLLLVPNDLKYSLYVSLVATFGVIILKTLIFYFGRWRIVNWS